MGGKQNVLLETKYRYNYKGQLTRQEDPGNVIKDYTYDIYGNRQSFQLIFEGKASPDVSLYYVYDDLYRLKQIRKSNAAGVILAEYEYDEKGNRKTLRNPQSGMETNYKYNDGNRVISLENKRQGTVISAWEYVYDVNGNILSKINKAGSAPVTISYQYDQLGRLTEEDYSGWKRTLYTYDAYSNRMKMMVEGRTKDEWVSVTSYEYGLNNRLEKETKKQGKTTETYRYRYDDNGNETFRIWEKTAPTPDYPGNVKLSGNFQKETPTVYEWRHYDGFNQLIRINQDEKEITYQYRGDGLRHSAQVRKLTESQGKTNIYYWDGSDIVAEQTDGEKIKTYLRGINLIAREIDSVVYYYIFNEHGDVTQLWSQSGTCKASYEYDAFGVERNPDKEDKNPFRYCGEYIDLETNTYYLRSRIYNPTTGRFLTEDTHWNPNNMIYGDNPLKINERKVDPNDPLGLNTYTYVPDITAIMQSSNRYVYGMNNPIMYIDQNGNFVITATVLLIAGGAALVGTIGGVVGNHIANQKGATGWAKAGYIAGGVLIGGTVGAVAGAAALPAATAAGFGGVSITAAGVSTIAAAGTSFGTMGTLIAQNPNISVNWSTYAQHGLRRMAERGITQQMVDAWVATGKILQQGADKFAYITREGMAVVDKAGKLITTYSSAQYDAAMQEIVKKLFGG
uniref:RHS repeat-associated core domain-containing protein n=1 Tax=Clostridium sp. NkU-1 TaxID=1095009 RepID=UPI003261B18D